MVEKYQRRLRMVKRHSQAFFSCILHGWQKNLMVANMNDGMGSLLLIPEEQKNDERLFKAQISEAIFKDSDGIDVLLSLNIDKEGYLFELDVWKVNYEEVISYANMVKLIKNQ